jgi:hypothetical protein
MGDELPTPQRLIYPTANKKHPTSERAAFPRSIDVIPYASAGAPDDQLILESQHWSNQRHKVATDGSSRQTTDNGPPLDYAGHLMRRGMVSWKQWNLGGVSR